MDFVVVIPARYGSTRLPGKPLSLIGGEPMVRLVAQRALAAGAAEVVVAVDDERVRVALAGLPVHVCLTRVDHASGSDRIAECVDQLAWRDDRIVVNLQGDEPFAPADGIRAVAAALMEDSAPMATLATPVSSTEELFDPNAVKLVRRGDGRALYFSRAPLPWARDGFAVDREHLPDDLPFLRHVGIYAYRAGFLRAFTKLAQTPLERAESLEQLRVLEHGHAIAVRLAPSPFPPGIDTPDDLARANQRRDDDRAGWRSAR